jgi:hypothetical protein
LFFRCTVLSPIDRFGPTRSGPSRAVAITARLRPNTPPMRAPSPVGPGSLGTLPTCSSTVTATTAVGTYAGANTCTGGVATNYSFSYVAGAATVSVVNRARAVANRSVLADGGDRDRRRRRSGGVLTGAEQRRQRNHLLHGHAICGCSGADARHLRLVGDISDRERAPRWHRLTVHGHCYEYRWPERPVGRLLRGHASCSVVDHRQWQRWPAGRPQEGDQIIVTFAPQPNLNALCSTWTSTPYPKLDDSNNVVTGTQPSSGDDTMTLTDGGDCAGGLNFGTIDLGQRGYFNTGTVTFGGASLTCGLLLTTTCSSIQWNGQNTHTITLGQASSGQPTQTAPRVAVYTPDPALGLSGTISSTKEEQF